MEKKKLFSGRATSYIKGRPAYAKELIDFLFDSIGMNQGCSVADIGAGTGIFSKQLLEKGCNVYCVEPNEDMRRALTQNLSDFENTVIVDGDAENTKLDSSSVDFVTVAQAFHWFDVEKFLSESKRILKGDRTVILIWNTRTDCDFSTDHQAVFRKYCPRFKGFNGGVQKNDERILRFFNNSFECAEFDNSLCYEREQFIDRCLSSSYSLMPHDSEFENYLNELNGLFGKYAENGILKVPNKSVVYWGKVND